VRHIHFISLSEGIPVTLADVFSANQITRAASVVRWSEFLAANPDIPDFLRSSGSGMGSTEPREYN
jgi:hypothetical protein